MAERGSFSAFACIAVLILGLAPPVEAAGWNGSITCTMKYSGRTARGDLYTLDETQRWVIGKALRTSGARTTYAVSWRDTGKMVEPIGQWTVGPASAAIDIVETRRADGSWAIDRTVASGFNPPNVVWTGTAPKPHPKTFPAIEFDFLPISIPARAGAVYQASQPQGTTPPSYYQFIKSIPGKSTCSWNLNRI